MNQFFLSALTIVSSITIMAARTSGQIACWKFNDGKGSNVITDSSANKLDGKILKLQNGCRWLWDDFEGSSLQFDGKKDAFVAVKSNPELNPDGQFSIQVKFTCDLSRIGKIGFASLICKGTSYKSQYSVMIGQKGDVLVYIKGLNRPYNLFKVALESKKEYLLTVTWDRSRLELYIDGKKEGAIKRSGRPAAGNGDLYIGGGPSGYLFTGIIKSVILSRSLLISGSEIKAPAKSQAATTNNSSVNQHSIYFKDFHKLKPESAVENKVVLNKWYVENNRLYKSPATLDLPDLTCNPGLKGKFNLYLGIRPRVNILNGVQLKTSTMSKYATILLPAGARGSKTACQDIMWAKNIEMNGQTITLHSISDRFAIIEYLRFVPTAKDTNTQIDSRVTFTSRNTGDDSVNEKIRDRYYIQRHYVNNHSTPPLSKTSVNRGFMLFEPNILDLVFPAYLPENDPGKIKHAKSGAKGETLAMSFAVRPLTNSLKFKPVVKQGLSGPAGTIPIDKIRLSEVRLLNKRFGAYRGPGEYMHAPVYLEPISPETLRKNNTVQYWLNIDIPKDAKPGKYAGKITLTSDGTAVAEIPVNITVYPFKLAPLRNNFQAFYCKMREGNGADPAPVDRMKSIGLNSLKPFVNVDSGLKITGTYDNVKVDFTDSIYERAFKAFAKARMDGNFFIHISCYGAIFKFTNRFLPDEKKYAQAYSSIIKQIYDRGTRKYGIKKIIFTPYDEVLSQNVIDLAYRDLKILKKMGMTTCSNHLWEKTSKTQYQKMVDKVFPLVDIIVLRYSSRPVWYVDEWDDIMAKARKYGKKLYHYNFNNGLTFPELESMRFATGWFYRSIGRGCAGSILWNYDLPRLNCRDDLDAHHTDWIYVYPPEGKDKGGPALLLEAMREGITDLRYIITLEDLIAQNKHNPKKQAAVAKAEKLLETISTSIDVKELRNKCSFLESSWDKTWRGKDGKRFASGSFSLPNGWTFEQYDQARAQIAHAIIDLQK